MASSPYPFGPGLSTNGRAIPPVPLLCQWVFRVRSVFVKINLLPCETQIRTRVDLHELGSVDMPNLDELRRDE